MSEYSASDIDKMVAECHDKVMEFRNRIALEYDVRILFACWGDGLASLAAAMLKNGVDTNDSMVTKLMAVIESTFTRESQSKLIRTILGPETKQ